MNEREGRTSRCRLYASVAHAESAARTFTGAGLMRIAFLLAHDDPVAAPFSKAFARCGGEAKAFDDYGEALAWLGVKPAESQSRTAAASAAR